MAEAKPLDVAPKPVEVAPAPQPAPAPAATSSASADYYIQLSSTPTQELANAAWARAQRLHPETLYGLTPRFQPLNIPGKGFFVRVQAGPLPLDEAKERCEAVRQADPRGGCLVVRK